MKTKIALPIILMSCGTLTAGVFTPLTLPTLTEDIRTWTDGGAYSSLYPNSSQTFAGVPFEFQSDPNNNTIFYGGNLSNPVDATLLIPVNIYGVTTAYTLINTAFGVAGMTVGTVTFEGSGGLSYTVNLVEGANVRDHYYGGFVNTTTDPATTEAVFGDSSFGHAHFDMQTFTLPDAFHTTTLENIQFFSTGIGNPDGKAFIAGATVASGSGVPDGGTTFALLGIGLMGLAGLRFRFSSR
jgi:hypothetical protein